MADRDKSGGALPDEEPEAPPEPEESYEHEVWFEGRVITRLRLRFGQREDYRC
jgi:hypothetical protein